MCGPQCLSGSFGRMSRPAEIWTPDRPACSLDTISTELFLLLFDSNPISKYKPMKLKNRKFGNKRTEDKLKYSPYKHLHVSTYCYSRLHDGALAPSPRKWKYKYFWRPAVWLIYVVTGVVFENLQSCYFQVSYFYTTRIHLFLVCTKGILCVSESIPHFIAFRFCFHLIGGSG